MKTKWMQSAQALLRLPDDLIYDIPKIVWIGRQLLFIENHKGLLYYSDRQIAFSSGCGKVLVAGRDLLISAMTGEQVTIRGMVEDVKIDYDAGQSE
ncbi:YabP/YqfC family sporulation protein [Jeotgalibacillus aurantiacus]|uniref:YabP/YqfC family sporulation protein n=1 Tax=Jeotgalibacillus aurantiacus TaxID=2763266 RepID=UPI001D09CF4C|nr:YabP/YqfC family sporulation protein [Jeotgalibacillus aurantiacus]